MAQRASQIQLVAALTLVVVVVMASQARAQDDGARHGPITQQYEAPAPTQAQALAKLDSDSNPESRPLAEPASTNAAKASDVAQRADDPTVSPKNAASQLESRPLGLPVNAPLSAAKPASATSTSSSKTAWWLRTALALGLVITLILLLRKVLQRFAGAGGGLSSQLGAGGRAPSGVLEVLGRFPVAKGHTLVLLKMDRRILLLGQTASGFTPLTEVRDPDEVASLLTKVKDEEGESLTARFNSILHEAERDQNLLDDPISIIDREPEGEPSAEDDPAASLRNRLLGLRGLEA